MCERRIVPDERGGVHDRRLPLRTECLDDLLRGLARLDVIDEQECVQSRVVGWMILRHGDPLTSVSSGGNSPAA
jgi:hypothetical protein